MRRKDREVTDIQNILSIIDECKVIRLAMIDGAKPYIVPLSFGYAYDNGSLTFYCHSAKEGRKLDILRKNNVVAFELDCRGSLHVGSEPCRYSYYYASVLGEGTAEFLRGSEKCSGMTSLMRHMAGREDLFTEEMLQNVEIIAIRVSSLSAKEKA